MNSEEIDSCIEHAKDIKENLDAVKARVESEKPDYSWRIAELKQKITDKQVLVICHKCGYPFNSRSKLIFVGCPSCNTKTMRIKTAPIPQYERGD